MKAALSNFVSLIIENEKPKDLKWDDILIKLSILSAAIYLMVRIDLEVYGYLTR